VQRSDILTVAAVSMFACVVFLLIPYGLSPDETHYWLWSYELDWSYYSKGPLTAVVIWCSRSIFGDTPFAVRLPALLFSLGSFSIFVHLIRVSCVRQEVWPNKTVAALFLLSATVTGFWYPVFFMTTDAPAVFFWMLTFFLMHRFFSVSDASRNNVLTLFMTGSVIGLGIWSKYTSFVLLGSVCIAILFRAAPVRMKITQALIVCFSCGLFLIPILYWNISYGWVNFFHNVSHASKGVSKGIAPLFAGEFVGAQIGLFGLFFPVMLYSLFVRFRDKRNDFRFFLLVTTSTLFGLCFLVSFTKRVYPNWTIPAYFSLFLLTASSLYDFCRTFPKTARSLIAVNCFATLLSILLLLGISWGLPGKILPTKKLAGWVELVNEIQQNRNVFGEGSGKLPVMTESYGLASQFAFLTGEREAVYCIPAGKRRMNQFDIWNQRYGLGHMKGQDVLLVLSHGVDTDEIAPWFDEVRPHPRREAFHYDYNSSHIREVSFYIGKNYSGKPFPLPLTF
jgi:4-amino-4-deoxy-L-arabinose transferase-like glycosyltransferase